MQSILGQGDLINIHLKINIIIFVFEVGRQILNMGEPSDVRCLLDFCVVYK